MEAQTSFRRRRREAAGLVPDLAPQSPDDSGTEPDGQRDEEDDAVQAEPATALEEAPSDRSYQQLFDAIPPDVLEAASEPLRPDELVCVCMDDRNPDDGLYSAGGLILLDTDAAVEQIRKLGITAVKSHPGCGAGAALAERRGLPVDQGDAAAVDQSMRLAALAGIRYAGASAVDAGAPHEARATLIFVDTPVRRSLLRAYLPPAFSISGYVYPNREALIAEALLSARIALEAGNRAGEAFSRERPFSVVFIGRDQDVVREHSAIFEARMQAVLPVGMSERIRVSTVF